ncbi:type II secretion system protein GspI [Clostridium perfringens]
MEAATEARMPTLGRSSGVETNGGRAWTWVRDVRPTGNASIVRIDVAVADRRGAPIGRATIVRPPDTQP